MAAGARGTLPSVETRPAVGFSPTTPQNADGIRTLPAMSVPRPSGEPPAAMIAPLAAGAASRRPVEAPRIPCPADDGLTVSSEPLMSEQLDLPSTMAPAAFMRRTASASRSATCPRSRSEPAVNRTPATASASLTVRGTPWSGGGSAGTPASDIRRAVLRAASNVVAISALMCGPTSRSARCGRRRPPAGSCRRLRMRRASSAAPRVVSSSRPAERFTAPGHGGG